MTIRNRPRSPKQKTRLEFVCTANNGRSPLAQEVAKDYAEHEYPVLTQPGSQSIEISSSGSNAERIFGKVPDVLQTLAVWKLVEAYQEQSEEGMVGYSIEDRQYVQHILGWGDAEVAERYREDPLFRDAFNTQNKHMSRITTRHEEGERNEYLKQLGIPPPRGAFWRQTTAHGNVDLYLPMAQENADRVEEIVEEAGVESQVILLPTYAGQTEPLTGAFLSPDKEKVMAMYDRIAEAARTSVDRFINEHF